MGKFVLGSTQRAAESLVDPIRSMEHMEIGAECSTPKGGDPDENFSPFRCSTSKWDLFADEFDGPIASTFENDFEETGGCDRNTADESTSNDVNTVEDGPNRQTRSVCPMASMVIRQRASLPTSIRPPLTLHATMQAPTKCINKRRYSHPLSQHHKSVPIAVAEGHCD